MIVNGPDPRTVAAALQDAQDAVLEFDNARGWLACVSGRLSDPFAAEVWVFDRRLEQVVLVHHRWRGWVAPGGRVEGAEAPREAARRELAEETGLIAELLPVPAAVFVRSYRSDWAPTLGLAFAAIADASAMVVGEAHQPVAWSPLTHDWEGVFPEDRDRIRCYARHLAQAGDGVLR